MDGLEVQAGGGSSVEKVLGVWEKKRFSKSLIKIFYSRLRLAFSENLFLLIIPKTIGAKLLAVLAILLLFFHFILRSVRERISAKLLGFSWKNKSLDFKRIEYI